MDIKLENELYQIDPIFFKDAIKCQDGEMNETQTCMYFGCECGDGWFKPLKKLIQKIKIINDIAKNYNTKFVCEQLKEKYGELRVYYRIDLIDKNKKNDDNEIINVLDDMFNDVLKTAENECWNVCELCGADGGYKGENLITTPGWILRICKDCAKTRFENQLQNKDN